MYPNNPIRWVIILEHVKHFDLLLLSKTFQEVLRFILSAVQTLYIVIEFYSGLYPQADIVIVLYILYQGRQRPINTK